MFGIFASEQSRARHDARNWLHLADKVFHFRRDQLPQPDLQALQQAQLELKTRLRDAADASRLKMAIERLEGCLRQSGGTHYPKSSMVDNVEFFLVAMILFLGIRAYFFQPFKIPTNSMWPSYYGMTPEVFVNPADEPGLVAEAFRFLTLGASPRRAVAPEDGKVMLAVYPSTYQVVAEQTRVRRWGIIPADGYSITLFVGESPLKVAVPAEFNISRVIEHAYFDGRRDGVALAAREQEARGRLPERWVDIGGRSKQVVLLDTGKRVRAGESALAFDILTGDQLFVDRLSYNFVRPQVGDGFVFRTKNIPGIGTDQYYIKRLVGVPSDVLEVRAPRLLRNGRPIEGSPAFEKNAHREGMYPGYVNLWDLDVGRSITVPPDFFYAMGDNSPDSSDSRRWGFVPSSEVVGRPLFIYFPFTRRWGRSP